jgi:transposase InsO family protein
VVNLENELLFQNFAGRELVSAIFKWTEAWYNPRRRHTSNDYLSVPWTTNDCSQPPRMRHDRSRSKLSGKPGQDQCQAF